MVEGVTILMIPRKDAGYWPAHAEEPPTRLDVKNAAEPSLFAPRYMPLRKIVVMMDRGVVRERGEGPASVYSLLRWQLGNPNVHFYIYPGCIDYLPYGDGSTLISLYEVRETSDDDIRASLTAGMLGVDFFLTERKKLLEAKRWLDAIASHYPPREPPCHAPAEAAALIGLYLRAQGDFALPGDPKPRVDPKARTRLYMIGALSVVPALMNWMNVRSDEADTFVAKAGTLMSTVRERVQGALVQRDLMHIAMRRVDDQSANFEIFGRLDSCLQLLMGALDASARVAQLILERKGGAKVAGATNIASWHKGKWLKPLEQHYPTLFDLVAKDTSGWHVMTILRILRNTIHSESLMARTGVSFTTWEENNPQLILSTEADDELRKALDAVADHDWALGRCQPGNLVHPGDLLESLFQHIVRLLGELVGNLPVGEHKDITRLLEKDPSFPNRYPEACCMHLGINPVK